MIEERHLLKEKTCRIKCGFLFTWNVNIISRFKIVCVGSRVKYYVVTKPVHVSLKISRMCLMNEGICMWAAHPDCSP